MRPRTDPAPGAGSMNVKAISDQLMKFLETLWWEKENQRINIQPQYRGRASVWREKEISGLEMATDTVANATKMIWMPTRSFQAVAKVVTSSKLAT